MSFGKYEAPQQEKVPTLLQYLKSCSKGVESKTKFAVDIIWTPGKFNNVTLQTHAFRCIANENHALYSDILAYLEGLVPGDLNSRMEVVILSLSERTIEVSFNEKKKGTWTKLGTNAFRFNEN